MRTRYTNEGMGWTARVAIALGVAVILAIIGLGIYGGMAKPPHEHFEQVLPDENFPR